MKLRAIWYWLSGGKRCAYCHEWFPLRELWCMFTGYDDRVNYMHLCDECDKELAARFQSREQREKAINAPKALCRECGKAATTTFGGMPMCAECDARLTQMFEHDKATGAWR